MSHLIAIAIGGACGALARFGITIGMQRLAGPNFPWGTFTANVIGCLLLGMLSQWAAGSTSLSTLHQRALGIGLLGALTTFSTFAYDTIRLLEADRPLAALGNVSLNLAAGLAAAWAGIVVVKGLLAASY